MRESERASEEEHEKRKTTYLKTAYRRIIEEVKKTLRINEEKPAEERDTKDEERK